MPNLSSDDLPLTGVKIANFKPNKNVKLIIAFTYSLLLTIKGIYNADQLPEVIFILCIEVAEFSSESIIFLQIQHYYIII